MLTFLNGNYLLDTNIVVARFAKEEEVLKNIGEAQKIFVPSIVLGELYFGANKSGRAAANIARVDEMIDDEIILDCDAETARQYGVVRNQLRLKGRPIPENDIWIAAVALQHDLTLATRDVHFGAVEGLRVAVW